MSKRSFSKRRKSVRNEQFYTKKSVSSSLVDTYVVPLLKKHNIELFIDSSAGDGYISNLITNQFPVQTKNYDIKPSEEPYVSITKNDYLKTKASSDMIKKRIMVGFNPPFGYSGKLADQFIKHSISTFKPKVMVFILPLIVPNKSYENYKQISSEQLPKNSFITHRGKSFDYPAFLCIYEHDIKSPLKMDTIIIGGKPQLPDFINSITQYKRHNDEIQRSANIILVRRIGNNCGKHGYVHYNGKWKEYRFATILKETATRDRPTLTPSAFLEIDLDKTILLDELKEIITDIASYRDNVNYKRTISSSDIVNALL